MFYFSNFGPLCFAVAIQSVQQIPISFGVQELSRRPLLAPILRSQPRSFGLQSEYLYFLGLSILLYQHSILRFC